MTSSSRGRFDGYLLAGLIVSPGQTMHVLIQVTDDGTPPLTSVQRVIVTVTAR